MIAEKDAANVSLGRIADTYIELGHQVIVYAMYYEKRVLSYFDSSIETHPLLELTDEIIEWCDCIFASTVSVNGVIESKLISARKPIYTHGYLMDGTIQWGGDISFVPSLETAAAMYDEHFTYSKIGIGEPKYDEVILSKERLNRLLFIDSGHYPFGEKGKKELAQTLLRICDLYPEYELCVKPRFLPQDRIITHQNTRHLYDVIKEEAREELPSNLNLLMEHKDLKVLIDSAHTVICMFTSAFVGAYTSGKGLIVLDGLESEDVYDVRWKHFAHTRKHLQKSGALVDYREVDKLLPHGVKCTEEYFDYLLSEKESVANIICKFTEYLHDNFFSMGRFPQNITGTYHKVGKDIRENDSMTWDKWLSNRYYNTLIYKSLIMISFSVNAKLDVSIILEKLKALVQHGTISKEQFEDELKLAQSSYREICIYENKQKMMDDDIDSGILLNAMYHLRKWEEIKEFPKKELGAYHLFRGFVAYDEKEIALAVNELKEYINLTIERPYIKEVSDMSNNRMRAFCILIEGADYLENADDNKSCYLKKMKQYYDSLYLWADSKGGGYVNKLHSQHYAYLKWLEYEVNKYEIPPHYPIEGEYAVYGAGILSRRLIIKNPIIKDKICVFIDKFSTATSLEGKPIIRLEQLKEYDRVETVIVTAIYEFENIKKDILQQYPNMNIIPLVEIEERS